MADVKLATPRLRVVLGDDSVHEVQTINADMLRYERTARQQHWPTDPRQLPITWMTFLAWAALKRSHNIDASITWEEFSEATQEVTNLDDDGQPSEALVEVGPTQPEPEPI